MRSFFRWMAIICVGILMFTLEANAEEVLLKDDFNGQTLSEMWKQTYPEETGMRVENGALNVKWGTVWYIPSKKFSIRDYPGGLSLAADIKFYPQLGYEWKTSSNWHPIGFQNNSGGIGTVYARFTVEDADRDGIVDGIGFQTKSTTNEYVTFIPGCDPKKQEMHQFRIDWLPNMVQAYLDGNLVATHTFPLDEPLWVVGRNEQGGTILDNFNVRTLPLTSDTDTSREIAETPQSTLAETGKSTTVETVSSYAEPVKIEVENLHIPAGASKVDDVDASEGKAVELSGEKKPVGSDLISVRLPQAESPGFYSLKLRMRVSDMPDLGKGWRVEVHANDEVVGWGVAHGYQFKNKKGFIDFHIPFTLLQPGLIPEVIMFWAGHDETNWADDSKPMVRLDLLEMVRTSDLPPIQITKVWTDKIRYQTVQEGTILVAFKNTTKTSVDGEVKVELTYDLEESKVVGKEMVKLSEGEKKEITFPLKHGGAKFGYEVKASAYVGGKLVDSSMEYFCVSDNPFEVATHANRFGDGEYDRRDTLRGMSAEAIMDAVLNGQWKQLKRQIGWGIRYWLDLNPSDEDLAECAEYARKAYVTMWEVYSWQPGGCLDMDPKVEIWPCGDDSHWLYSKRSIAGQVASLKKHGIGVVSYILPYGQGLEALDLLRERPDWFCTSVDTKDFSGYNQADIKKVREFRKRLEVAPKSEWPRFQQEALRMPALPFLGLNYTREDALKYVEERVIDSIKVYDWDGVRWDCGHLNTGVAWGGPWVPFLDFYGKPLCKSPDEMVAQTVYNLKHFKTRLREVRPNFCMGTNWGGVSPLLYPKMTDELMRDGGWLLDEETRRWSWPDSQYRFWNKYYEFMSDRGELMTSLGGHYNPYGFLPLKRRSFYVMGMYHMIFGLAGHGHPEIYLRSKVFPIGDPAQFAVRFGRYLFDNEFRRVDTPNSVVQVVSSRPLWWEKSVLKKVETNRETWIVHLVNPPVEEVMEENEKNELPSPVADITVSLKTPKGKIQVRAWVLTSESWTTGEPPITQSIPLEVKKEAENIIVNIPEVLFWKTVVFEFK